MNEKNSLRFAFSRTVTRPSFIEMAPFLYQESYGSAQIRGNADLQNGYNYNIDLRYELFEKNGDMLSITAYYKHLKAPIERVQTLSGGSAVHSFRNADNGMATGVEIEFRKEIVKDLRFGVNGSYMYTNVKLPEGGAYTNSQRALQGSIALPGKCRPHLFTRFQQRPPTQRCPALQSARSPHPLRRYLRSGRHQAAAGTHAELYRQLPLQPAFRGEVASQRPAEPRHPLQARSAYHRR